MLTKTREGEILLIESDEAFTELISLGTRAITIEVTGLTGPDEIQLRISGDNGKTYPETNSIGGAPVLLNSANNTITLRDGGKYQLNRPLPDPVQTIKLAIYSA